MGVYSLQEAYPQSVVLTFLGEEVRGAFPQRDEGHVLRDCALQMATGLYIRSSRTSFRQPWVREDLFRGVVGLPRDVVEGGPHGHLGGHSEGCLFFWHPTDDF